MRKALVTGSAWGIGRAIAMRLAADGLSVVGVDIRDHPAELELADAIVADLASVDACAHVFDRAGVVDVLVNNAAFFAGGKFEEADAAELDRMYAINLRAPILLSRAFAPQMARSGWGRIVNVSSVGVHTGGMSPSSALYSATKAGLHSLTKYLARAYGASGVTVNAVAPAWIDTEMGRAAKATGADVSALDIPLRREGTPSEVAGVVAFLVSDDSSYVTGTVIDVNGGFVMR
jgi:NAD(P)-dependent dehydrogenase (short-subunit alcohol dehydrogenase family)